MNANTRAMASSYLEWAKLRSQATYNLATSGIMGYPLSTLPVTIADLEINGPTVYGYAPLQERLASKCGVSTDCVVAANGTSMANHLAMAAVISPGDEVLVEMPTYGLLLEVASYLGAEIRRFDRKLENDFQIDLDEIKSKLTLKTRLIVLTNLHNPSGAFLDEATLTRIGEMAASVGALVMVDEVYLDMVSHPPVRSSFHLGDNFLITNSLTKAYGLSGIRCGWILAQPDLARRIWRLSDLFNGSTVHAAELISVIALDNLEQVGERARDLLGTNRAALDGFLDQAGKLEVFRPVGGTVVFPRLKEGSVDELCQRLRTQYETTVVPGHFFEMPEHFRIGIGGDTTMTATGLRQLTQALKL